MIRPDQKIALFMEGAVVDKSGKMGYGVLRYSPNEVVCLIDTETAGSNATTAMEVSRGVPIVASIREAIALGADVLVLGIAPAGGLIPDDWLPTIDDAVAAGLCIVNGLHDLLAQRYPKLSEAQWIWDVRVEPTGIGVGYGLAAKLSNLRVLMIGTDMSCGKMTAGLELQRSLHARRVPASFVATGQIGITITGGGVPLDAVRVDYASGAIEHEMLIRAKDPIVIVEGQGALIHPGSTANLPLLRGAMPTHLVLCHRANATSLQSLPDVRIPPLGDYIRLYEDLAEACGAFARPVTIGLALNTSMIEDLVKAKDICSGFEQELGLPVTDPLRFGMDSIVERLL